MTYTALAVLGVVAAAVLDLLVLRTRVLTRPVFWVSYAIVFGFQLLVDGTLACRHVVIYSDRFILGPRLACAPIEDLMFGFSLIVQTLSWWLWWGRRLR